MLVISSYLMHEATGLLFLFTLNIQPNKKVRLTVQCAACTHFPEWTPNFGWGVSSNPECVQAALCFSKQNKLLKLCTCQLPSVDTALRAHIVGCDVRQSVQWRKLVSARV